MINNNNVIIIRYIYDLRVNKVHGENRVEMI